MIQKLLQDSTLRNVNMVYLWRAIIFTTNSEVSLQLSVDNYLHPGKIFKILLLNL